MNAAPGRPKQVRSAAAGEGDSSVHAAPGRLLPHPVLSLLLAASWLALSHSLAVVHLLSAALIGWGVPQLLAPFLARSAPIHWGPVCKLVPVVLWDIVMSNFTVARLVLGRMDTLRPAWVVVPLASDHAMVNALLATIITTTPGTVSTTIDEARGHILVHALDCADPVAMAQDIKARYEVALLQIFGVNTERSPA